MVHHETEFQQIRKLILFRDNYACQFCGRKSCKEVHHIDGNRANNDSDNLITICRRCNNRRRKKLSLGFISLSNIGLNTTTKEGKRLYQKDYMRWRRHPELFAKPKWKANTLPTTSKEGKRNYMKIYMRRFRANFEFRRVHELHGKC